MTPLHTQLRPFWDQARRRARALTGEEWFLRTGIGEHVMRRIVDLGLVRRDATPDKTTIFEITAQGRATLRRAGITG